MPPGPVTTPASLTLDIIPVIPAAAASQLTVIRNDIHSINALVRRTGENDHTMSNRTSSLGQALNNLERIMKLVDGIAEVRLSRSLTIDQ
jgi:hypothetical protein